MAYLPPSNIQRAYTAYNIFLSSPPGSPTVPIRVPSLFSFIANLIRPIPLPFLSSTSAPLQVPACTVLFLFILLLRDLCSLITTAPTTGAAQAHFLTLLFQGWDFDRPAEEALMQPAQQEQQPMEEASFTRDHAPTLQRWPIYPRGNVRWLFVILCYGVLGMGWSCHGCFENGPLVARQGGAGIVGAVPTPTGAAEIAWTVLVAWALTLALYVTGVAQTLTLLMGVLDGNRGVLEGMKQQAMIIGWALTVILGFTLQGTAAGGYAQEVESGRVLRGLQSMAIGLVMAAAIIYGIGTATVAALAAGMNVQVRRAIIVGCALVLILRIALQSAAAYTHAVEREWIERALKSLMIGIATAATAVYAMNRQGREAMISGSVLLVILGFALPGNAAGEYAREMAGRERVGRAVKSAVIGVATSAAVVYGLKSQAAQAVVAGLALAVILYFTVQWAALGAYVGELVESEVVVRVMKSVAIGVVTAAVFVYGMNARAQVIGVLGQIALGG